MIRELITVRMVHRTAVTVLRPIVRIAGSLNPKFPGGVKEQAARLKEEGHKIIYGKGKKSTKVQDFEKCLA